MRDDKWLTGPQISLQYSKIGFIVWSNTWREDFTLGPKHKKSLFNLKSALSAFLYNSLCARANDPEAQKMNAQVFI